MNNTQECIHSIGNASVATLFSGQIMPFIVEHPWLFILPLTIVLSDLWFGVNESKKNKIEVRFSGAGWKTLRKLMDYYTLIILGFVIGECIPTRYNIAIPEVCLVFICIPLIFDICSIGGHFLNLRGIKFNFKKVLLKTLVGVVKSKDNDVGNALEEGINEELNHKN